jgi:hypothetical protein
VALRYFSVPLSRTGQQRVLILCTLREIVDVLNREVDLLAMLRAKIRAAKLDRK